MSGERTEKASPQKKRKAAEKGDRLASRELIAAAAMLGGAWSMKATAPHWVKAWRESYRATMVLAFTPASRLLEQELSPEALALRFRSIVVHCLTAVLFFGLCSVGAAVALGIAQGGGRLTPAAIAPQWSRLNPGTHLKNIFGLQAVVRLGKSLIPASIIASIACGKIMRQQLDPVPGFASINALFVNIYDLLLGTAIAMALWSLIDYFNTWRSRETRLKMTKQDVKDEMKESEGSPQIKRRIRQIQRQSRKRKLRADVKHATVVITNPTHFAVALSFDFVRMEAPKVLAKGRNLIALQIREEAIWAGVPIVENPPLARSLYRSVEAGQSIPFELYATVAAILAYLYRQEQAERSRRPPSRDHDQEQGRRTESPSGFDTLTRAMPAVTLPS
jgi:flagellar biosynthetic protein FlhB